MVVVAAVEAATFFALFLVLFLWCFLATLVVVAGFAGVVAASCAANAEPSTIAAPSIKAESFFMSVSLPLLRASHALHLLRRFGFLSSGERAVKVH